MMTTERDNRGWTLSRDAWDMLLTRLDSIDARLDSIDCRLPARDLCRDHTQQIDSLRRRLWVQTGAIGMLGAAIGALLRGLW